MSRRPARGLATLRSFASDWTGSTRADQGERGVWTSLRCADTRGSRIRDTWRQRASDPEKVLDHVVHDRRGAQTALNNERLRSERRSRMHPVLLQKIYEGAHLRQEQAVAQG
jgi:hypothetical protein